MRLGFCSLFCGLIFLLGLSCVNGQGYEPPKDLNQGANGVQQARLAQLYMASKRYQRSYALQPSKSCAKGPGIGANLCAAAASSDTSAGYQAYAELMFATSPYTYSSANMSDTGGVRVIPSTPGAQGLCDTCVAFAVVAAAQAAAATELQMDVSQLLLSVQDLAFCGPAKRQCRSGWNFLAALQELQQRQLLNNSCMPYKPNFKSDDMCLRSCSQNNLHVAKGKFSYVTVSQAWEAQRYIRELGAVVTSFKVMSDFDDFFKKPGNAKAVYTPKPGATFREWHAVTIVGYHNEENGGGYWLCLNSWGKDWGDNGLFRVVFDSCDVLAEAFAIKWSPTSNNVVPQMPLQPAPNKKGCFLYKAKPGDFLSRVAWRANIGLEQLLLDNVDRLDRLDVPVVGKQLLICNPKPRTQPSSGGWAMLQQANRPVAAPKFLEGVANIQSINPVYGKAYYRIMSTPTASWMYVEIFNLQSEARAFCNAAGGSLATITSAAETMQVEQLLNYTLEARAKSAYDNKADVILWIDLTRSTGSAAKSWAWESFPTGGTIGPTTYNNWATNEPNNQDGRDCGVLGWFWPKGNEYGKTAWYSYSCGYSNYAIPALCKLPPAESLKLPRGMFNQKPAPPTSTLPHVTANSDLTIFTYTSAVNKQRVTIHVTTTSWDEAVKACQRSNEILFAPETVEQLYELRLALRAAAALSEQGLMSTWLAAEKKAGQNAWLWSTAGGQQARPWLLMWNPGEPNSEQRDRACLIMVESLSSMRNNVWMNDHGCDTKVAYACTRNA